MSDFQQLKVTIIELLRLSKDAAHVHVGLLVFVLAFLVVRRRSVWLAWAAAVLAALVLEVFDIRDAMDRQIGPRWAASLHDVVNTLVWPTVLALLIRAGLLVRHRPGGPL